MSGGIKFGKCRLTGRQGHFVKSHIIPEALTEATWRGQPLTQQEKGGRLIKRRTSWYDDKLVTSEGEAVLQKYDDWAIKFFRTHKLIWSAIFPPLGRLETADHQWLDELNMGSMYQIRSTPFLNVAASSVPLVCWQRSAVGRFAMLVLFHEPLPLFGGCWLDDAHEFR
jgi:hypothetical protein